MAHFFYSMQQDFNKLWGLLEPVVTGMGYELVEVEWQANPRNGLLRIYIDHKDGITVDDCGAVSLQVSALLDVEDPIPGHYSLEVSSPGLDRPLRKEEDFYRFAGEKVKLKLDIPIKGRRNFTGRLIGLENGEVVIDVDGTEYAIPINDIGKARLVPQF